MIDPRISAILPQVEKPARYTGGEYNSILKENRGELTRFAFCFPDIYEVGMSHLGMRILYDVINRRSDACCERVFAPWPDMEEKLRQLDAPLYALESGEAMGDFDMLGFTLQYELSYTNILNMLELGKIPVLARERTQEHPLVLCGGPCAFHPEPLSDFVDFFVIGDGEDVTGEVLDVYADCRKKGASRQETLAQLAGVPGVYVPGMVDFSYREDGTVDAIEPTQGIRLPIMKRAVDSLEDTPFPDKMLVPYLNVVHDRISLEIMRGCTRGCRFCQAGMLYRPLRERSVETLAGQAQAQIDSSGYEEVSLSSLSSGDYSRLGELVRALKEGPCAGQTQLSLPSLRLDAYGAEFMDALEGGRKAGLTLAPEAGSQRLRDIINKNVTEEDLEKSVGHAFASGWNRVKLYFMIGLPYETDEDILGIAELVRKIRGIFYARPKEERRRPLELTVSASNFVPKPHTPFQWAAQDSYDELTRKQQLLREAVKKAGANFSWHDAHTSILEAAFARGDRRLGRVLLRARELGCRLDGWRDLLNMDAWRQAFADCGLDMAFYAQRRREEDETLPWDHISCGVSKEFLARENHLAQQAQTTPDCRKACNGCGLENICGGAK